MLIETCFKTPLGTLKVSHDEHFIYQAEFCQQSSQTSFCSDLPRQIATQLSAYFSDPRYRFDLPFKLQGSMFQQKVWNALSVIPSGQTKTYGELAKSLETSARAIGQACKTNPLPLFIPCHRVVSQTGIGGYMGKSDDVTLKQALLKFEGISLN